MRNSFHLFFASFGRTVTTLKLCSEWPSPAGLSPSPPPHSLPSLPVSTFSSAFSTSFSASFTSSFASFTFCSSPVSLAFCQSSTAMSTCACALFTCACAVACWSNANVSRRRAEVKASACTSAHSGASFCGTNTKNEDKPGNEVLMQ